MHASASAGWYGWLARCPVRLWHVAELQASGWRERQNPLHAGHTAFAGLLLWRKADCTGGTAPERACPSSTRRMGADLHAAVVWEQRHNQCPSSAARPARAIKRRSDQGHAGTGGALVVRGARCTVLCELQADLARCHHDDTSYPPVWPGARTPSAPAGVAACVCMRTLCRCVRYTPA